MGTDHRGVLPPAMTSLLESVRAEAHEAGYAAGRREAVAEVEAAVARASDQLAQAVGKARAEMATVISEHAPSVVAIAIELAKAIVGDAAVDPGAGLAGRILAALEQVDDEEIVIRVNPADAERIRSILPPGLRIEADAGLQPGDAIATGRWARIDMTIERAWQNLEAAFDA
jgi:flagellar biosynthesis/type III secretory pathway protein FliH